MNDSIYYYGLPTSIFKQQIMSTLGKLLFKNKTAIVTGAGGGLGRSYALELAKRGCNVVVNDIRSPDSVIEEIKSFGGVAVPDTNDITNGQSVVETALQHFGAVDILVNNAGILRDKSFAKLSPVDWSSVLNVHLQGTFSMCHAVWPGMMQRGYGRIINVGSGAGCYGNFGQANYSAAKMGIVGLSQTLAKEGVKHNIRVNTILPIAASKMTENLMSPELLQLISPEHVAPLVAYLAHEACEPTGELFECGGGWFAAVRYQRASGLFLATESTTAVEPASVESIHAHIHQLRDFSSPQYPQSPADALSALMQAKSRGSNVVTASPPSPPSSSPVTPPDALPSTQFLQRMERAMTSQPDRLRQLCQEMNAVVVFDIVGDEDERFSTILHRWVLRLQPAASPILLHMPRPFADTTTTTTPPPKVTYNVKITCSDSTFLSLVRGKTSPEFAFMRGLLKVKGQVATAMKLKTVWSQFNV